MPDMWNTPEQDRRDAAEFAAASCGARFVALVPLTTGLWQEVRATRDGREVVFSISDRHMRMWHDARRLFAREVAL